MKVRLYVDKGNVGRVNVDSVIKAFYGASGLLVIMPVGPSALLFDRCVLESDITLGNGLSTLKFAPHQTVEVEVVPRGNPSPNERAMKTQTLLELAATISEQLTTHGNSVRPFKVRERSSDMMLPSQSLLLLTTCNPAYRHRQGLPVTEPVGTDNGVITDSHGSMRGHASYE